MGGPPLKNPKRVPGTKIDLFALAGQGEPPLKKTLQGYQEEKLICLPWQGGGGGGGEGEEAPIKKP